MFFETCKIDGDTYIFRVSKDYNGSKIIELKYIIIGEPSEDDFKKPELNSKKKISKKYRNQLYERAINMYHQSNTHESFTETFTETETSITRKVVRKRKRKGSYLANNYKQVCKEAKRIESLLNEADGYQTPDSTDSESDEVVSNPPSPKKVVLPRATVNEMEQKAAYEALLDDPRIETDGTPVYVSISGNEKKFILATVTKATQGHSLPASDDKKNYFEVVPEDETELTTEEKQLFNCVIRLRKKGYGKFYKNGTVGWQFP